MPQSLPNYEGADRSPAIPRLISILAGCCAVIGGLVAIAGWVFDVPRLADWTDAGISMFVNTALCAILTGLGLLLLSRGRQATHLAARMVAVACLAIAVLTLSEHLFGWDLGIDTLVVKREWGQRAAMAPMRMGLPATFSFIFLSVAVLLATGSNAQRRIASGLAALPLVIAVLSLTGYWFGADELFGVARLTAIALQTSMLIAVLSLGAMAAIPEYGMAAALSRNDAGGAVLRRLIAPIIMVPLFLGWLRILGQQAGMYDVAFGTALRTIIEVVLLLGLLWWTAKSIGHLSRAAQHADAKLAAIVESSTDAIVSKSLDGMIQSWNIGAAHLFGYSASEAVGKHITLIIPKERFDEETDILSRISRGQRIEHFETVRVRKDGTRINVSLTVSPIRDVAGQIIGASKIARDITEQKTAEDALRDQAHTLELLNRTGTTIGSTIETEALLQAVTDIGTELSGAKFGAFFYNSTDEKGDAFLLYTLAGAPREAFEKFGKPRATPLFEPTFAGEGPIRCDDVLKDRQYGRMAPHYGQPAGHLPVRSYLAVPVVSQRTQEVFGGLFFGHPEVGVFTDKTERIIVGIAAQASLALDNARLYENLRKAADERAQLLEAERAARSVAERAGVMKDEFLANLSHELRTPLNAIYGWSQLLLAGSMTEEDKHEGYAAIHRNAKTQTQLIDDLLDMSRIIAGKVRLDVQPVDPATIISAAIESVRPAVEAKQIRLRKILDPHAGPVSGDPTRLQQIIWNLLTNAIKFTPKEGKVDVLLERVNSHLEITVVDSGIGIKPEFLPIVFERFRQADATTTRIHGGLGLGLSIVKNLVELHGGTVGVHSDGEGKGSTFVVKLPLAPVRDAALREHPTAAKSASIKPNQVGLEGIKVLVVDDEPDARTLIQHVLTQCKAEVTTAASSDQAINLLRTQKPDVIVSDIGMPNKDGYQFIREVRALSPAEGGKTPAVALTAYARSEDRTRAMLAGFQVHIAKPIEPTELIATVVNVAGRSVPSA